MKKNMYEKKLNYLRANKIKLELALKEEASMGWGEESMMHKQSLLNEIVKIEKQIAEIKGEIKTEVAHPKYEVEINGKKREFTIVPANLVAPREGRISEDSPLAQKLTQSKANEIFEIETAKGTSAYKVLSFS